MNIRIQRILKELNLACMWNPQPGEFSVIAAREFIPVYTIFYEEGAFALHIGGEVDVRGTYWSLAVGKLTNTCTKEPFDGSAERVVEDLLNT